MTEAEILEKSLSEPGVKLLFGKFDNAADKLPMQAINALLADDIPKAKRCAYLWDVYKNEIPRIAGNIINSGDETPRWGFFNWLFNR